MPWRGGATCLEMPARPELVAICDRFDSIPADLARWYTENFPSIHQVTSDYKELLANPEVEAVYCAVPTGFAMVTCLARYALHRCGLISPALPSSHWTLW